MGKVKLALTPFLNEWWNVGFFVSARGLRTGTIPAGRRVFEIEFDFIDHQLTVCTSAGEVAAVPLIARSVASFYAEFMATLDSLGIDVSINPLPCEIPNPISCDINADSRILRPCICRTLVEHPGSDPVGAGSLSKRVRREEQPGSLLLGFVRSQPHAFSGRLAEPPVRAPRFMQIAEDQENFSCGFWPGNVTYSGVTFGEPAFYAYHYPAQANLSAAAVRPSSAYFDATLGEFILRYDDVRGSKSPEETVMAFFESTYEASAASARWNRSPLETSMTKGRSR